MTASSKVMTCNFVSKCFKIFHDSGGNLQAKILGQLGKNEF